MPDDEFELGAAEDLLDERPTAVAGDKHGSKPEMQPAASRSPNTLLITRNGRSVTIGFSGQQIVDDENCLAPHREQLLKLIEDSECDLLTFDLTGVRIILSGMLGLLASARNRGREIELLNPSPEVQEILRMTKLDTLLLIRGTASQ